jgi:hypothetical protein
MCLRFSKTIGLSGGKIMGIYVVAYCGCIDFDSPILLVTPDVELAKKTAKEATLSDRDGCSGVVIERWDFRGNYYGIIEYD